MKSRHFLATVLLCGTVATAVHASCGTASCPLEPNTGFLPVGNWCISTQYTYIGQSHLLAGNTDIDPQTSTQHHAELETYNRILMTSVSYQFNGSFSVDMNIPYIWRKHSHIHNHHGAKLLDTWDIAGLGDTWINGQYRTQDPLNWKNQWVVGLGIKAATGATRLKNQENQEAEVPVQPGSGSTDYRLTLQYRFAAATIRNLDGLFAELPMQLTARYTWNGVGTDSWKNGDELSAAVTTQWPLTRTAQVEAGILAKYQKTAQPGTTGESVSSTGGKSVIANLGYQTALTPNLNWSISGYLPLYQYVNGQQLGVDSIIQTGFEWML